MESEGLADCHNLYMYMYIRLIIKLTRRHRKITMRNLADVEGFGQKALRNTVDTHNLENAF